MTKTPMEEEIERLETEVRNLEIDINNYGSDSFEAYGLTGQLNAIKKNIEFYKGGVDNAKKEAKEKQKLMFNEIFGKFDEYACIKDDAWYKELKDKLSKEVFGGKE